MMSWWEVIKQGGFEGIRVIRRFTPRECRMFPNHLYLFGDNEKRKGSGPKSGQAVVRYEPNSHGLRTKKGPTIQPYSYWVDESETGYGKVGAGNFKDNIAMFEADLRHAFHRALQGDEHQPDGYDYIVIPSAGWGTGHSRLQPDRFTWHPREGDALQRETLGHIHRRWMDLLGGAQTEGGQRVRVPTRENLIRDHEEKGLETQGGVHSAPDQYNGKQIDEHPISWNLTADGRYEFE